MTRHELCRLEVPDGLQYLENNSLPPAHSGFFTFILAGTLHQQESLWGLLSQGFFYLFPPLMGVRV